MISKFRWKTLIDVVFVIGMVAFAIVGWMRPEPEPDCTKWKFGVREKIIDKHGREVEAVSAKWICIEGRLSVKWK